jgi:nucleoside-diphosphate-sugar epimerase
MSVFFFGYGYSSAATAQALRALAPSLLPLAGTVRDPAAEAPDATLPLHRFTGTASCATLAADLAAATHVVVSIPPGPAGDVVLARHAGDLAAARNLQWLCYFSTVGVYGDFGGALVDESAPTRPENPRSQQRVVVEQRWREFAAAHDLPLLILRLAGIYGPGRSAFDKLREGSARRIVKPGQVFNRIHVADIGRVTALAAAARLAGTFNLADDLAAPPQDVVAHAADLLGLAPPPEVPFAAADMSPMARSFYADNKRVSNAAIKRALAIELLYPDYRAGLAAILAAERASP